MIDNSKIKNFCDEIVNNFQEIYQKSGSIKVAQENNDINSLDVTSSINLIKNNATIESINENIRRTYGIGSTFNLNADNLKIINSNIIDEFGDDFSIEININNSKCKMLGNTIETNNSNGCGIYHNSNEIKNTIISCNDIKSGNYGILINEKSLNSKNTIINNNVIDSFKGDAIALNNPVPQFQNPDSTFHNASIIGNILKVDDGSTSSYSGFGISIAESHNICSIGNVIETSRTEGIHFEGTIDNCIAIGNIFDNCKKDGCSILNITHTYEDKEENGEPIILSNNQFKKSPPFKSGTGIHLINDGNNIIENNIINNNIIKNFDTGIFADGVQLCFVDKNLLKNNTSSLKVGVNSRIIGENISIDSDYLITSDLGNGTIVDKIYSNKKPQKLISSNNSNKRKIALKGFYFTDFSNFNLLPDQDNYIQITETPYAMQGKIYFELFGNLGVDTLIFISDLIYDGSSYILSNTLNKGNNAFKNKSITIENLDNQMSIKIANTTLLTDSHFKFIVEFDGYYLK